MYGKTYSPETATPFVAGVNSDVALVGFSKVATEYGDAVEVTFEKEGKTISGRQYEVNPANVKPVTKYVKNQPQMQTQEEAVTAAYQDFNSWVKSIVINYTTEEAYEEAMTSVTDFDTFVEACKGLLPEDFATQKGNLVLTYNTKGFLAVPSKYWVTNQFFAIGKDLVPSKRIVTVKPEVAPASTQQTNW